MSAPARGPERFALQPVRAPRRSWGNVFGAGFALLVLLVGVPVGLWALSGPPPVPTVWPDRTDLSQPLGLDALLVVLRGVVWLAWLQFAVCTLVEVVSIARGGELPRPVPLSGRSQALARALVGTVLVGSTFLGTTGAAHAGAVDPQPVSGPSSSTVLSPDESVSDANQSAVDQVREQEDAAPRQRMVQVPGVPSTMTDVIGHKVAIVAPPDGHYHDNLWDIAERTMGDGRRWKEIFALNEGRVQPDGQHLVLGRLIQPGWVLIMPEDARNVVRVEALPADAPAPPSTPTEGGGDAPGSDSGEEGLADTTVSHLATGGLLSAVLLGALLAERRRRRSVAPTDAEQDAEVDLRWGADLERSTRLDHALRALAVLCGEGGLALPQVYAVTMGGETLELHLAPPLPEGPSPWTIHDGGARWELPHDAHLPDKVGRAPYPALVCLGRDDTGRDVLLDLEALGGTVNVTGAQGIAREVVSALAVQLAHAPWADGQEVHGFRLDPATATVGGDRLTPVADVAGLVRGWIAHPRHQPAQQVLSGRMRDSDGARPVHLVLGESPEQAAVAGLAALMGEQDRGIGVVAAGPLAGSRWTVEVDDTGRMHVPLLDVEVEAVRVGAASTEALAGLFDKARRVDPLPAATRVAVPPCPRAGEDDHWSTAAVRVGVLGDLEVRTSGHLDPSRIALATEVVTFLALQATPVHRSVVGASIWPGGASAQVRDATLDRVRDWLGTDAEGNHLLRENGEGRLWLAEAVAVDWHAFCALVQRSRGVGPHAETELLRRAMHLVRGEFLTGVPPQRYAWLARTRIEQQAADLVVDSAHRLSGLCLPTDPGGAAAAARAGLRHVPTSQTLWRDLVVSEFRGPEGPGPVAALAEMRAVLDEHGIWPEAETSALVEELLPGYGAGHGAGHGAGASA